MPTEAPAAPTTAPAAPTAPAAAPLSTEAAIESFPRSFGPRPLPEKMLKTFRDKAKPTGTLPDPTPAQPETKAQPVPEDPAVSGDEAQEGPEVEEATQIPETKPEASKAAPEAKTGKEKKPSPWRVADQWKAKATDLERQLVEAKKGAIPEAQAKEYTERITKAEARVKELEDEIRFVNYEKHPEFIEKYHEPYAQAFRRAVAELSEVQVTDAQGTQRPATPEDILGLISLPLGKAREVADAMFGPFADDAMSHRKEIKALFDQRQTALEKAKTSGAEREKQQQTERAQALETVSKAVGEIWVKANQEAIADPAYKAYFTPREGDEEWNGRLQKGYEFTDKVMNYPNARDPGLTAEQREEIVRSVAAMRNRSAAFGPLRWENQQLREKLKEAKEELEQFRQSEPGSSGGSKPKQTPMETGYTLENMKQGLRKYAK